MSQIPVVYPSSTSSAVKIAKVADETGTVNMQVVQLGLPDQGAQIIDLLTQILDELRAQRMQDATVAGIKYELTKNIIDAL